MSCSMFNKILFKLFLFITFLKFSIGKDKLFPNQTIGFEQTLVSQSQRFELGFFSRGTSKNSFLGIWYKDTPSVVVWVANRNNPIIDPHQVFLGLGHNGTYISRDGRIVWWVSSSGPVSSPVLQLLDTGNLVLTDRTKEGYIWQSFHSPTDTWVPGLKIVDDMDAGVELYFTSWRDSDDPSPGEYVFRIENHGLPELVIIKGKEKMFRTGTWNGKYFNGSPQFPNAIFKPELEFRHGRLISISRPYDSSIFVRSTLDTSGRVNRYTMNAGKDGWNPVYRFPAEQCDEYGHCGPNGLCTNGKAQTCQCLKGFSPMNQNDWDLQGWFGGCIRTKPLNCGSGDGFLEVRGVKYPDMLKFSLNMSMNLGDCKTECLKKCSCTAYANPYITNGGSGCVMWFGDLIDIRELAEPDSKENIYIRLPISELDSINKSKKKERRRQTRLLLISIASGVLVLGLMGGVILSRTRRKKRASRINGDLELPLFKWVTIMAATNSFSRENIIGEGGFGPVYKGNLSPEEEIAVKRLSRTSGQGLEEFKNEVILISKLQHTNLVRLLGCCIEGEERMLIYEYLKNKSLDYFVFDQSQRALLNWAKRFDIIMGITRGLLYLHHDSRLKIIHRDLKTSNILLDDKLIPKISDFGIARIFVEGQPIARTRRVVGTYGYIAPEYAIEGKFSVKSDIFSLGVVLLEIVSGKKNRGLDHHSLLGQAWLLWKEDNIMKLMDECMTSLTFDESQVKRCIHVALLCVQRFAKDRPLMSSVLFMLGADEAILPQPKEPGFFLETSYSSVTSTFPPSLDSENNTITITDLEAR